MDPDDQIRASLQLLATDQPPAPDDRIDGVRRRHRRRRRIQGATAAAAVLVIVAGVVAGITNLTTGPVQPAATRHVPSWALPWPDHEDGSLSAAQKAAVVAEWKRTVTAAPAGRPAVVWYLAEAIDHASIGVAVFETTDADGRHHLISAWDNSLPDERCGRSCSDWAVASVPAPSADYRGVVGVNVHPVSSPVPGSNPPAWAVALLPPGVSRVAVVSHPLARGGAARVVPQGVDNGLLLSRLGQLYEPPVEIGAVPNAGRSFAAGPVGLPGNRRSQEPQLAAVHVSHRGTLIAGGAGQGTARFAADGAKPAGRRFEVDFGCRGADAASVVLRTTGGPLHRRVRCDGTAHRWVLPPTNRPTSILTRATGSAWAFVVAALPKGAG